MPYFYGQNQFYGVVERAANIAGGKGNYTASMFQADFPQFFKTVTDDDGETTVTPFLPQTVLDEIINQANAAVQPNRDRKSVV